MSVFSRLPWSRYIFYRGRGFWLVVFYERYSRAVHCCTWRDFTWRVILIIGGSCFIGHKWKEESTACRVRKTAKTLNCGTGWVGCCCWAYNLTCSSLDLRHFDPRTWIIFDNKRRICYTIIFDRSKFNGSLKVVPYLSLYRINIFSRNPKDKRALCYFSLSAYYSWSFFPR